MTVDGIEKLECEQEIALLNYVSTLTSSENVVQTCIESTIIVAASSLPDSYILLDTCGSANLFNNRKLISNICDAPYSLAIDGIQADSKPVIARKHGDTIFGQAHYSAESRGNVLSFAVTRDRSHDIGYNKDSDMYYVQMSTNGPIYMFKRWENIYVHNTEDSTNVQKIAPYSNIQLSEEPLSILRGRYEMLMRLKNSCVN